MDLECQPEFPVVVHSVPIGSSEVYVLRDDLLRGGSKERACVPYLGRLVKSGVDKVVYASPFAGFAQVALAISCERMNIPCTLVCEEDKTAPGPGALHPFSQLAAAAGAEVIVVRDLATAENAASEISRETKAYKIPLGFNDDSFRTCFEDALSTVWSQIQRQIQRRSNSTIRRIWAPIGSGTLSTCLRKVVGREIELCLVDVRVLEESDPRITRIRHAENTLYFRATEAFHEKCERLPPLPSNIHYDAKTWRLIQAHGTSGDLWWNVAR